MTFDPLDLPELAPWRGNGGVSAYLALEVGVVGAIAAATLFWPEFVEVDDHVFLRDAYDPASLASWQKAPGITRTEIEAMINHVHLWDVFDADVERIPREAFAELAETLASTWRCALRTTFPDRRFDVSATDDPADYGPIVTFFQVDP